MAPTVRSEDVHVAVRGYVSDDGANLAAIDRLRQALATTMAAVVSALWPSSPLDQSQLGGGMENSTIIRCDWANTWWCRQPGRKPDLQLGDDVIWLDPGMAFGTGTHPSTQLILRLLEKDLRPGMRALDVGTGSGILAIAAHKLGAAEVLATDIDPEAIAVARANLRQNEIEAGVDLLTGSLPDSGQFDLICANILADVIASLLLEQGLAELLAPAGIMLLSGIITPRRHVVDLALAACDLRLVETLSDGEWLALAVSREQS